MATASTLSENAGAPGTTSASSGLLVNLGTSSGESLEATLANLAVAFTGMTVDVATSDPAASQVPATSQLRLIACTPTSPPLGGWELGAADLVNTCKLMQERQSTACLSLGPEAQSLSPETLRSLADAVVSGKADLATPRYSLGPRDGLVTSAILYPVTRALFVTRSRYPLSIDLAFSARMADRLAAGAQKHILTNQPAALVWPVAEAAAAGLSIAEVPVGPRALPPPDFTDLNSLLALVAGSFFADIDAKASLWQRVRLAYASRPGTAYAEPALTQSVASEAPDVQPMIDAFCLAYTNLHEIWSLVLPPNSLLGLKRLSLMPAASFRMPDALWVRIVYDFILAYRLRTINRGHLLGALTPLYLAWVASFLLLTAGTESGPSAPGIHNPNAEGHIEALATAFEVDKPYLVSRWRWPDRFNP
jgi:hypothetical protein